MGIVRAGQSMAGAACAELLFNKIRSLLVILMVEKEGIRCQSAVGIRSATCKISVDLILRNEHFMLIPFKTVSCFKGNGLFRKLLKLSKHPIRCIVFEAHDRRIFFIRCCKSLQPVNKVKHILLLRKILLNSLGSIWVST